jgi:hypothetical protein
MWCCVWLAGHCLVTHRAANTSNIGLSKLLDVDKPKSEFGGDYRVAALMWRWHFLLVRNAPAGIESGHIAPEANAGLSTKICHVENLCCRWFG